MTPALDPERSLALSYIGPAVRPALAALWTLDAALGAILAGGREPMISRIKLAWWREALERLDREHSPTEPVLAALAGHVLPAGIGGAELAAMTDAWETLLSPEPLTRAELAAYAEERGGRLFLLSARLLRGEPRPGGGEKWALVDLARHCGDSADAEAAIAAALSFPRGGRWPARLRPLGMLAALAERDLASGRRWEKQGSPARMMRMLRHRLTGR